MSDLPNDEQLTGVSANNEQPETRGKHLNEYIEDFQFYSGKASEINRSLALAGVGIIWIFHNAIETKPKDPKLPLIPKELFEPLFLLAASLTIDLLQYFLGYIIWWSFYHFHLAKWDKTKPAPASITDLEAPSLAANFITMFFYLKIICMFIAYYHLFVFIRAKM
jgi:hypothetical protein